MEERAGEAFELGEPLTVMGRRLEPGDRAPEFELLHLGPSDPEMRTIHLADTAGMVRLLNVVNSLDTPVRHLETRQWERLRHELPPGAVVYTVSMDLPNAQARWQSAEGIMHELLSAHRNERFGHDYGVLIKEWRLLQRAVFVIDRTDHVVYADYVADQMKEPDYAAAMQAVRRAANAG